MLSLLACCCRKPKHGVVVEVARRLLHVAGTISLPLFFARVRKHQAYQALLRTLRHAQVLCRPCHVDRLCQTQPVGSKMLTASSSSSSLSCSASPAQAVPRRSPAGRKLCAPGWTRPARLLVMAASSSTPVLFGRTHPAREICAGGPCSDERKWCAEIARAT